MATEINELVAEIRKGMSALEDAERKTGVAGFNNEMTSRRLLLTALMRISERFYMGERVTVSLPDGSSFASRIYEVIDAQPPLHVVADGSTGLRHAVPASMLKPEGRAS